MAISANLYHSGHLQDDSCKVAFSADSYYEINYHCDNGHNITYSSIILSMMGHLSIMPA